MRGAPKGLHKTRARLADGTLKVYWYAWKGGPRLEGEPGAAAFDAAYRAALRQRGRDRYGDTLSGLVAAYRGSPEFGGHAESTRREWTRFLDLIQRTDGDIAISSLPVDALSNPRVRQHLLAWRDQWRQTPRKADYAVQVLSAVLSWAVGRGLIAANVLLGHEGLYQSNRADEIWSEDEICRFVKAAPSLEVGFLVRLACLTGLRRGDLIRLEWSQVGDVAIVMTPAKSSRRRNPKRVTVPLLDETLELLSEIRAQQERRWGQLAETATRKAKPVPQRPMAVLTNTRGRPWSANGAEHQIIDTKAAASIDKHLHDCRGTFATRLRLDGATVSEIADILGWEEARVERLLARYVDADTIVRAFAERIRARAAARRAGG